MLEEVSGPGRGQSVDEARGCVEEPQHRIEVAICATSDLPTRECRLTPGGRQPARAPHGPKGLLDTQPLGQRIDGSREHPVDSARRACLWSDAVEGERRHDRFGEQHVARPPTPVVELDPAKRSAQPPQTDGVGAADRRAQHVDDDLGIERLGSRTDIERAPQECQEGPDRDLGAHRQVGTGRVDGHPGTPQDPPKRGGARATAHDDGHRRPRRAAEQVGLAQQCADERGLLCDGPQQVGLNDRLVDPWISGHR